MSHPITTEQQMGQLLRGARKTKALSQEQLARRLGLSQARLSSLELNPGRLNVAQLLNVLNALGLKLTIEETDQNTESQSPVQGEW